jgi:hypothetical protein
VVKRAKRRGTRSAVEESRAEPPNTGPELPQDLAMIVELLAPERIETLRRQLIDGTAGDIEPLLHKIAYSGPLESEAERRSVRFVTTEEWEAEQAGRPPADPPKAVDPTTRSASTGRIDPKVGYRIAWDRVVLDLRRRARALVEDPQYQESLRRRLADGKAPRMRRLLWQSPEKKARDPYERRRGKPPLPVVMSHRPGQYDPLAAQEKAMLERQAEQEEQEARIRQETQDREAARPAAAPHEPSDPDALELYQPEP